MITDAVHPFRLRVTCAGFACANFVLNGIQQPAVFGQVQ